MEAKPVVKERLRKTLCDEELERAAKFRFERDRHRFVIRQGILRTILARYLGAAPEDIRFQFTEFGKPEVALSAGPPSLFFNLSHSGHFALFAFSGDGAVGVDIERMVPERADAEVAERFFSDGEVEMLRGLTGSDWRQGFFNCWTRKEAYIKARGEGLSFPLDAFEVSLLPEEPAVLHRVRGAGAEVRRWMMVNVCVEEGYVAALVAATGTRHVCCWRWGDAGRP